MATVYVRKADYNYDTLRPVIFEIMDSTVSGMIQQNSRVLIKPNLLAPAPPEKAVVTHPLVIKAVAEYVLEKGARPHISDSPATNSFEKILKESSIQDTLGSLDVGYREFRESAAIDVGRPLNKIEIARDALHADVMINLPKLKTHTQMLLTLGIKNLFGCVVGMKKPEWHFRTGIDREMFALLLVKIYQAVRPTVTILDGILAMEGQGPGKGGKPRGLGLLMGSTDTAAMDNVVCRMLDIHPDTLLTNKIAAAEGLMPGDINIDGPLPVIHDFTFPEMTPLVFGPKRFHRFFRRHLVQRPVCDDSACRLCGECWNYCPAAAITHSSKRLRFDYDKCIRCYCCIEVCPYGALKTYETRTGKISRRILRF